jgi:hypothetical protein
MLLGPGSDLDGLLGQNRLRLIPLHTTEPAAPPDRRLQGRVRYGRSHVSSTGLAALACRPRAGGVVGAREAGPGLAAASELQR